MYNSARQVVEEEEIVIHVHLVFPMLKEAPSLE